MKGALLQITMADTAPATSSMVHPQAEGLIDVRSHQKVMTGIGMGVYGGWTIGRAGRDLHREDMKSTLRHDTVMNTRASSTTCREDKVAASQHARIAQHCREVVDAV